jgi:uncharacterized protein (DUF1015 family)
VATITPFRALRPAVEKAEQTSCVPYDVVHGPEARAFVDENPLSFLRVTRAEAEFDPGESPSDEEVFARARKNLDKLIADEVYLADPEDAIYIYQLAADSGTQTGVVACCSLDEYEQGLIKKHENVRPDKVADRTEHLLAVGAQTGLIFLAFRNTDDIRFLMAAAVEEDPLYDFVCLDGIHQRIWRVTDTAPWIKAFAKVPSLYIADGHHRAESAKLAREKLRAQDPDHNGTEEYNFVLAGLFPSEDLNILPYNRVVKSLNGCDNEDLFAKIRKNFIVVETIEKVPHTSGEFCMYVGGQWYKLRFNRNGGRELNHIESLDVSILQDFLLEPVLGIHDPRTDTRLEFVGGKRGTDELERLVDEGDACIAFSLYPTTMEDLLTISDLGETMPPKSTWFEPKLKDGLLVHMI